jgi:hypothetical protein
MGHQGACIFNWLFLSSLVVFGVPCVIFVGVAARREWQSRESSFEPWSCERRKGASFFRAEHRLVEIEGSQHGFAVHDDPQYLSPQSQEWQAFVIRTVADWTTASS